MKNRPKVGDGLKDKSDGRVWTVVKVDRVGAVTYYRTGPDSGVGVCHWTDLHLYFDPA